MDKLLEQLNQLKHIKPRKDWVNAERELLLSQITSQSAAKPQSSFVNGWFLLKSLMPTGFLRFAAKPAGVLSVIAAFIFSTGIFGVNASRGSLPGDFLYPVKLTSEKMKVGMVSAEEKKAVLHVKFAEERVKEIEKVASQDETTQIKKEKIKVAATVLKNEMEKTMETLDKVKQEPKKAKEIVETVKQVDQKAEELSVRLNEKKEQLKDDKDIAASLDEVKEAVDETGVKAMEVIVDKHEKGAIKLSDSEIIETVGKIDKMIGEGQKKVDQAVEQVEQVKVNVVAAEKTGEEQTANKAEKPSDGTTVSSSGSTLPAKTEPSGSAALTTETSATAGLVQNLTAKPGEAEQKLAEAKDLLNHGDLGSAIEKVQQVTNITKEVTQSVKTIEQAISTVTNGTASSESGESSIKSDVK